MSNKEDFPLILDQQNPKLVPSLGPGTQPLSLPPGRQRPDKPAGQRTESGGQVAPRGLHASAVSSPGPAGLRVGLRATVPGRRGHCSWREGTHFLAIGVTPSWQEGSLFLVGGVTVPGRRGHCSWREGTLFLVGGDTLSGGRGTGRHPQTGVC